MHFTIGQVIRSGRILINGCFLNKRDAKLCNHILLWCLFAYKLTLAYKLCFFIKGVGILGT